MVERDELAAKYELLIVFAQKQSLPDCEHLLSYDRQNLDINTIKLIEACPWSSVGKAWK